MTPTEDAARDERAAWLAAFIVERMGGTNDIPAWVRRSAEYWHVHTRESMAWEERATKAEAELEAARPLIARVVKTVEQWNADPEAPMPHPFTALVAALAQEPTPPKATP